LRGARACDWVAAGECGNVGAASGETGVGPRAERWQRWTVQRSKEWQRQKACNQQRGTGTDRNRNADGAIRDPGRPWQARPSTSAKSQRPASRTRARGANVQPKLRPGNWPLLKPSPSPRQPRPQSQGPTILSLSLQSVFIFTLAPANRQCLYSLAHHALCYPAPNLPSLPRHRSHISA
jgi:hypothetical protein